jgi:branched-chain amino acid transport system ATP-binding protein
MEKMNYKRIYMKWVSQRLEQLEMGLDSKKSYVPIYDEKLRQKHQAFIDALSVIEKEKLEKLSFLVLSKDERILSLKKNKIEKLDKAYYWKERKIKHRFNKALESKNESLINEEKIIFEKNIQKVHQIKEIKLNQYLKSLNDKKLKLQTIISREDFKNSVSNSESFIKEKTETLTRIRTTKVDHLSVQTKKHVEKLNQRILKLKHILSNYDLELRLIETKTLESLQNDPNLDHSKKMTIDHLDAKTKMRENSFETHLSISHLTMTFSGLKAVDDLSFDVKKGSIFGLIGPNGAGKTTVFNCITQFYKPKSGDIFFRNNKDEVISLLDYPVHHIIKHGIARTFQNVELIWELNILDNMLVGAHSLYKSGFFTQLFHLPKLKREEDVIRKKATDILTNLGLIQYKDFYPLGLPYGILKKIELARTLMTDPKLIILDEPAAGLNDFETKGLAKTIREINKNYGCTIFLVEHDMELVMDICDEICAISFGKKLAIGTPKEIQNHPLVREAYLGGE